MLKKMVVGVVALAAIAGGVYWFAGQKKTAEAAVQYKTAQVQRGDLVDYISATGTVEPEKLVDVGAQVGGMIASFGKDVADSVKTNMKE